MMSGCRIVGRNSFRVQGEVVLRPHLAFRWEYMMT